MTLSQTIINHAKSAYPDCPQFKAIESYLYKAYNGNQDGFKTIAKDVGIRPIQDIKQTIDDTADKILKDCRSPLTIFTFKNYPK